MSSTVATTPDLQLAALNESLRESYSHGAADYDAQRQVNACVQFFFDAVYATVDRMIGPTHPDTIHLELPVGTGRFARELRRRGRTHRIVGIDAAPGMLAVCNQQAASSRLELSLGDAFRLPLADESVDIVTSLRFFHLFPKAYWPRLLAEMQRVLRPGGILIAEMRNLFRGIGCGIYKEYRDRWLRGDHAHHFILPHEVRRLFAAWQRIELHGAGLDGLDRIALTSPTLAHRVHAIARVWPFRYLAKELLIKAYKPTEGSC